MDRIYLDCNSTTQLDPRVEVAMRQASEAHWANPASQHAYGQLARRQMEMSRQAIVARLGGDEKAHRLVFTSGGTEANNLAILGRFGDSTVGEARRLIISSVEHPSISGPARKLELSGVDVFRVPVDGAGVIRLGELQAAINSQTRLVSIMLVNNETGVIQPVAEAARICRSMGVAMHCDAVQAIGKIPVDIRELGVGAMTVTAHKIHGPTGVGGLLFDESALELSPILFGGVQQLQLRPGSESVSLATGLARSIELALDELHERSELMSTMRDTLEAEIRSVISDAVVNGAEAPRAPHTSNLSFPGIDRQALLIAADQAGIAISTGSACASGSSDRSPVLLAMGVAPELVDGSIRLSLSARNTVEEVRQAANRIISLVKHLRRGKSTPK